MGDVRQLFAVNQLAPSPELQATYLEQLASDVRSGKIAFEFAALVTDAVDHVEVYPFGRKCNNMELIGLLEYAKRQWMAD